MKCCPACFGDRGLQKSIFPLKTKETGTCSYCGSKDTLLVAPKELFEYFELLISAYRSDGCGKLLIEHFRQDWGLFDHPSMDDPRAKDLLAEIMEDGNITREKFSPIEISGNRLGEWEKLRDELMYRNRFFPSANINLERLESLLSSLALDQGEFPVNWFRARIQVGDNPYSAENMGAPPKRDASHGRANPAGIPYLYLGSNPKTAVSEVRPHTGEIACIMDFTTPNNLKLVDLRQPRKAVSPFLLEDAEEVREMRSDIPFLERLGDELTRPVVPQAAAIDYTPSQYLCEFIKKCGYDGVLYRSSVVSDGINLALFDPACARPGTISQYRVTRVSVEAEIDRPV